MSVFSGEDHSATGGTGKRVGYYEHVATRKKEVSLNYKLLQHKPRRIPAVKVEAAVWAEVKKFVMDEAFAKNLLERARLVQGLTERESKLKDLENKSKLLDRQIALLAERIGRVPENIDPQPLINQLGELQQHQVKIMKDLTQTVQLIEPSAKLVSFESLEIFKTGLTELIQKGETDWQLRAAIAKLIVHKIEILNDGFEIHFHVGEAHYSQALDGHPSDASFFVSFTAASALRRQKIKKPSDESPSEGFKFVYKTNQESKRQGSQILSCDSSRRLTNGGGGGS